MAKRKIYSAFISSVYESLRDERSEVIDCLLDHSVFPVCMEHFTSAASQKFNDIEKRIDESDFLILILGRKYGSTDENGVSWTEREYEYARQQQKPMVALFCDELIALRRCENIENLTADEKKQINFSNRIGFGREITGEMTIHKIITQFISDCDFSQCSGWVRGERILSDVSLSKWRDAHKAWNVEGKWYHVHISPDDMSYIRTGTIFIRQNFDPENYKKIEFDGLNYNARYDPSDNELVENKLKRTHWTGTYHIDDNGNMFGIFMAKREFSGSFGEYKVDRGTRRGIHDFMLDISKNAEPDMLQGEFHDEAPSPKFGLIYAFRSREKLLDYLIKNFKEVLENSQ